jgi:glutathione S-transferase
MSEAILYGVEGSYYAAKIRAYLMCKGIPFREVSADRSAYAEQIVPRVGYPIVPVIVTPTGETLQDTAEMIDYYEARLTTPQLIPHGPRRWFAAYLLELLADEWIKLPALHYRWAYNREFATEMMGRNNDPDLPKERQRQIGEKIASSFSGWPTHLGVTETTRDAVEASYMALLSLLDDHLKTDNFILGDVPSFADCALAGPLYAHLYHDPNSGEIMRIHAPNVYAWAARIRSVEAVPNTHRDAGDELPESLLPILAHLAGEYVPVLMIAMPLLQAWLRNNGDKEIPLHAGKHRFVVGRGEPYEAEGLRSIFTFEGWKVQRLLDLVRAQPKRTQQSIRSFCADLKIDDLLSLNFPNRLARRNFKIVHEIQ